MLMLSLLFSFRKTLCSSCTALSVCANFIRNAIFEHEENTLFFIFFQLSFCFIRNMAFYTHLQNCFFLFYKSLQQFPLFRKEGSRATLRIEEDYELTSDLFYISKSYKQCLFCCERFLRREFFYCVKAVLERVPTKITIRCAKAICMIFVCYSRNLSIESHDEFVWIGVFFLYA